MSDEEPTTLEGMWDDYRRAVFAERLDPKTQEFLRQTFVAGAVAALYLGRTDESLRAELLTYVQRSRGKVTR